MPFWPNGRHYYPRVGHITWWERLFGWRDIRCETCGTIGGASKPGGGRILACTKCKNSDWLRSLPRVPHKDAK